MQRLAQIVVGGREEARFRPACFFGAQRAPLGGRVLFLQFLDELLVLVAQAYLCGDCARLAIHEKEQVPEHRDPHYAECRVAVAPEEDVAQRQQAEDRHGERVQRRGKECVRDDAQCRAAGEARGDQAERERFVGPDQHECRRAPDDAGDGGGDREPPAPSARRCIAIARAAIRAESASTEACTSRAAPTHATRLAARVCGQAMTAINAAINNAEPDTAKVLSYSISMRCCSTRRVRAASMSAEIFSVRRMRARWRAEYRRTLQAGIRDAARPERPVCGYAR